jgi:hypothetical protein
LTVLERFSRKATLAYARAREPRNYVGRALFPDKYVNELTFEYWKDLNLLPVMASVQAFGAEAEQASREGVERVEGAIPTIKRKIPLTGRALVAMRREGAGDEAMVADILYNDLDNMIDAVHARVEALRIEALHSGKLVLAENGVKMTVDYGVPSAHQETLTGDDKWSNEKSSPIQCMQEWVQTIRAATGITPTRALTSSEVITHLMKNTEIRQLIYGDLGGARAITRAQLNELLVQMELPQLLAYDEMVRRQKADGTYETFRFLPSNKFILLPGEAVGETLLGPTEDAMLDADIETHEMAGIYAAVYRETMDPPVIFTKAAICAIPTFPLADAVFQATVL